MSKVSVIIPTYNRAKMVCEAVESVLSQSYQNFEIIVVDDGSTDCTKEALAKFGNAVTYLYQQNKGASAARNLGIANASGDYIAFLDSDDLFLPDKLILQISALEKNPKAGMIYSHALVVDEDGVPQKSFWNGRLSGKIYPHMLFIKNSFITTPTVVVRANVLKRTTLFDETMLMCEDIDLWRRVSASGDVLQVTEPLAIIRIRKEQTFDIYEYVTARTRYYQKAFRDDPNLLSSFRRKLLSEMYFHYGLLSIKHDQFHLTKWLLCSAFKNGPFRMDRCFMLAGVCLLALVRKMCRAA